jgi:hypothetical protein
MMQDLAAIQERIKKGFFNDIILMLSSDPGGRKTAYEVAQLTQERLQVLGPVIENIITESLKPKLKRIFAIIQRKNMLPPVPKSLQSIPIDIEFISMLALAQKASATGGVERLVALIGNLVPVFPEAKNYLNVGATIELMSELLDNPEKVLNGPEVVQQQEQAQQQAAQKQQAQADLAHGVQTAGVAANAAQVLSQTQIGGGDTAIQQLLR